MNLAIILSAVRHGASCANHVKVESLIKDNTGKLCGAHVRDMVCLRKLITIKIIFLGFWS